MKRMLPILILLGISGITFGAAFVLYAVQDIKKTYKEVSTPPEIGTTYLHVNPGSAVNPDEEPDPFVWFYTVWEVKGESVHIRINTIRLNGMVIKEPRMEWVTSHFLRYDTKLDFKISKEQPPAEPTELEKHLESLR